MRRLALLALASACGCGSPAIIRDAARRPNVIIVLSDDQGYGDFSAHGNPVLKTPHLDALRAESVRLADFHVAPMCMPTRGQLLTGMDALRNGARPGRNFPCRAGSTTPRGGSFRAPTSPTCGGSESRTVREGGEDGPRRPPRVPAT